MSADDVPDWLHTANPDPTYQADMKKLAHSREPLGSPMEGHDLGECVTCDAARLRDWWDLHQPRAANPTSPTEDA